MTVSGNGRPTGLAWGFLLAIAGVVAGLMGTLAIGWAVRNDADLRARGVRTTAVVTRVTFREHGSPTGKPLNVEIRFDTGRGSVVEEIDLASNPGVPTTAGETVRVVYDPRDPATVRTVEASNVSLVWVGIGAIIVGATFAAIGIAAVIGGHRAPDGNLVLGPLRGSSPFGRASDQGRDQQIDQNKPGHRRAR